MIRIENLRAGYGGSTVLNSVSLRIHSGGFVGLLGPNGSGKTTLLHTVSGVVSPSEGTVHIDGDDLRTLSARERAKRMAAVPQRPESAAEFRVRHIVAMGRYPHTSFWSGTGPDDEAAVEEAMRLTGTLSFADRLAGELSGGELQRVFLARALAQRANLLLLDEATAGLDAARKIEFFECLRRRNADGVTILAAVHDLNLAALYCTRLVFLKHGRILCDGPTHEVFTEATLTEVYETPFRIVPHPVTGVPQACLVPCADGSSPDTPAAPSRRG